MKHYINENSFGSDLPANWESIAAYLNNLIDEQDISDDQDAVNDLWERFCSGDMASISVTNGASTCTAAEAVASVSWDVIVNAMDDTTREMVCNEGITDKVEFLTRYMELLPLPFVIDAANPVWYAVMRDRDDDDWGTGSRDYDEAVRMAQALRDDGYSDAYIAVIDDGDDPVCTDEITDF